MTDNGPKPGVGDFSPVVKAIRSRKDGEFVNVETATGVAQLFLVGVCDLSLSAHD